MHFLLPKISLTLENTQQRQLLKHSGKWKSGEKVVSQMQRQIWDALKTRTWQAPPQRLGVCPGPPRSRHHEGIRCARDLLWKTSVRGNGEGARRTTRDRSDHMKSGEESLHWKHLRLTVPKKKGCQKSWNQSHPHQQCLPRASLPAAPTLSSSVLHEERSAGSLVPTWWWSSECTGGVLSQSCSAQSEIREVLLHGHHNRPVLLTRPHPVPISPRSS